MPPVSQVEVSSLSTEGGAGDGGGRGLSREDCLCPICLDIFLEPVTLPCEHTFCKACFLESADKASMCCPLCRKRVATWSRLHSRKNTLVNTALWTRIQAAFPLQCQRRIRGQEGGDESQVCLSRPPRVSEPGEVRREYEDQISKLAEEKRAVEDAERSASEEYIKSLLAEEEQRLAEERRRQEGRERQLEDDERLAKLLSLELNTSPISESQINARTNIGSAAKKKHKPSVGDIQKFFSPVPHRVSTSSSDSSPTSSFMANKENIIHSQGSTSLSRDPSECPMPRLDYYGQETDHSSTPSGPTAASLEPALPYKHQSADVGSVQNHSDRDGAMASSGKRKGSEMDLERCTKRPCSSPSSSSSSSLSSSLHLHELLQQQLEEELAQRRHQEEEDRRMALLLQKTLDREEKRRATDRSKGSKNAYGLRESPNEDRPKRRIEISPDASVTSGSSDTVEPNVSRTKTGVTAGTNRSNSQSEKPKKQTTLKEMFDRRGKH